jgi:hypothetical protein
MTKGGVTPRETPGGITPARAFAAAAAAETSTDEFEGHVEEMFEMGADLVEPEGMFDEREAFRPPPAEFRAADRADLPPVRLARLSSEELEHTEDKRLDEWYEEKLYFTGDNLFPIKNADRIVAFLAPQEPPRTTSNGYGAATKPAIDVSHMISDLKLEEEEVPLPELSDDPSNEELLAYARAHPAVRRAMRTFRAKIVKVEKR